MARQRKQEGMPSPQGMPQPEKVEEVVVEEQEVEVSEEPKKATKPKGIEVEATAKGFTQRNVRVAKGTRFKFYGSIEEMGSWMKCIDPELEEKRIAYRKEKMKGLRELAQKDALLKERVKQFLGE